MCFFFKVYQVTLDWSVDVLFEPLHTLAFKITTS